MSGALHWEDAAFLAERVLTCEELLGCVTTHFPLEGRVAPAEVTRLLHALLSRRLARLGRLDEARRFVPTAQHEVFDRYASGLSTGRDASLTAAERATALADAARTLREWGRVLLSTELAPDFRIWDCNLETDDATKVRASHSGVCAASADEQARWVAADLAWEAADLMPATTHERAQLLCQAGSWLKRRDPDGANRFYRALVTRCGGTRLGREAARLRWFPDDCGNP